MPVSTKNASEVQALQSSSARHPGLRSRLFSVTGPVPSAAVAARARDGDLDPDLREAFFAESAAAWTTRDAVGGTPGRAVSTTSTYTPPQVTAPHTLQPQAICQTYASITSDGSRLLGSAWQCVLTLKVRQEQSSSSER